MGLNVPFDMFVGRRKVPITFPDEDSCVCAVMRGWVGSFSVALR